MSRIGLGLILLIAVLAALAMTILLTAPRVVARHANFTAVVDLPAGKNPAPLESRT
jgi:hypothetical protein